MMIHPYFCAQDHAGRGCIAGTGEGIVTVGGKPARRRIYLYHNHILMREVVSTEGGNYLIANLDPSKRYLLLAVDWQGYYEPVAYDRVQPSVAMTPQEQWALWQSWQ